MTRLGSLTAVAGILLTFAIAPARASSWAQTEPAVGNCVPYTMEDRGLDLTFHAWGITNYADTLSMTCPITSQTGVLDATTLHGVQVVGYDGHSGKSVTASLCVSNPTTGSYSCGSNASSGSSTVGNVAVWASPPSGTFLSYYTATVWVSLPAHQCTSSGLFGCDNYRESTVRSYNVWRD